MTIDDNVLLDWLGRQHATITRLSNGNWNVWMAGYGDFESDTIRNAITFARVAKIQKDQGYP